MGARRYDAIICDIDGCLGPESHAPLDAGALATLARHNVLACARADRPVLTLCSGRPQPFAEALCRVLANDRVPCVAENGVWVYDPASNRFDMDPAILAEHLDAVHHAQRWVRATLGTRGVVIQPGKTASMSLWHEDTPWLLAQVPMLREAFAREGWPLRVSNTVAWINCDLAHVSKSTGLARVKAATSLTRERLMGIGDTLGDLAIREHVALFACPANADPALKAHADFVASAEQIRGVLEIVERLAAPA